MRQNLACHETLLASECCLLYPGTLFATSKTFPNVFPLFFAVIFSSILVDFIAVLEHSLGQNGSKMAYKGQKVQKVMVQPIVSFLMVVKELTITL